MSHCISLFLSCILVIGCGGGHASAQENAATETDPLPSWTAGPAKKAIVEFVRTVTEKESPHFVPVAERIATFDNDGTLWVEQPAYTQVTFMFDRVKALAATHPDWKTKEPFKWALDGDHAAIAKLSKKDYLELASATLTGTSVEDFRAIAKEWLLTAKHPRYKQLYTECVYQPMIEVMPYLRANGFKTYIVSGGGQEFIRVFSDGVYGVPPENVIGSAIRTKYVFDGKAPKLMRLPTLLLFNDEEGKPEDIDLFIGRKPLAAFGNSDGDRQMLEWTQSGRGKRFMLLVHHDDDVREYAYGPKSHIGTFSDSLMAEAKAQSWTVVSMKDDWRRVFAFEPGGR